MGFLDRFTKDPNAPDAFTMEVVARIRALASTDAAEALDANTVAVTWSGRTEPEPVDISEPREPWKKLRGFDRIEFMDQFIERLAPGAPEGPAAAPAPVDAPAPEQAVTAPAEATSAGTAGMSWEDVARGVLPILRPGAADDGALAWPVGDLLEATAGSGDGTALDTRQLEQWGVREDEVRAAAVANLEAVDPAPDQVGPDTAAWVPTAPAGLQSSWLASPARLLDAVGLDAGIVLVPLRSELVIVDPADTGLVASILRDTLAILEDQPDMLCPVPFHVTRDDVRPWTPPDDHPAAPLVQRTRGLFR